MISITNEENVEIASRVDVDYSRIQAICFCILYSGSDFFCSLQTQVKR